MENDLFGLWFFGMFFAFFINLLGDTKPISRAAFNVVFWPLALLIVCFKGALTHFKSEEKPKSKRNAR